MKQVPDYQALFRAMPGHFLVLAPDLRIVDASDECLAGAGVARDAIVGRPILEVFPDNPADPEASGTRNLRASLERVLATRTRDAMALQQHDVRRPDGVFEARYWSPLNAPVLDTAGRVAYILHRVEEVTEFVRLHARGRAEAADTTGLHERTERMEAELIARAVEIQAANEQLRRLDARKNRFFENVSHELRTPLTLILGPAERLLAGDGLAPDAREAIAMIARNAHDLQAQVDALLEFARLEAGQVAPAYLEFDLAELVRLTAADFEPVARKRGIAFAVRTPSAVRLEADADMVRHMLLNLFANAFKFTPPGGTIACDLLAGPTGDRAVLRVADSGPGVPPELREAIFERFFQVDEGATRRFGGTGLGLAIAKDLVELHGGRIEVHESEFGGAAFEVALPTSARAPLRRPTTAGPGKVSPAPTSAEPPRAAASGAPLGREVREVQRPRVLIVEDNADMARYIAQVLGEDYEVVAASDGDEGLARAAEATPDLILTDVMMPRMSGDQFVIAARRRPELDQVPIVLLTARADDALRVSMLRMGAQDYLTKPFIAGELRARVSNLVARRRAEVALRASEAKFRTLIELAPEPVLLVDERGRIGYANVRTRHLFGYDPDELVGRQLEILVPERFREAHVAHRAAYHAAPRTRTMGADRELLARHRDGHEFPVDISLSPVRTPAGLFVIAMVRDITKRKASMAELARREGELRQALELTALKDHFLSSISHELKTPLSLITGYAELLQDRYAHDELIEGILDGAWRITAHLNNVLDYSALMSGHLPLYIEPIDVGEVVTQAIAATEERMRAEGLSVRVDLPAEPLVINADAHRVSQMLFELLDNARKFTPAGGVVTVSVAEGEGRVRLTVADTGQGLSQEDQARIFGAFAQLQIGNATRRGGLGLGLAIVKAIAKLHGGEVRVESEPGAGARFTIELPSGEPR